MNKKTIIVICTSLVVLALFTGIAIGTMLGGNQAVKQVTEEIQKQKNYENVVTKTIEERDLNLFPTMPIFEKVVKNEVYEEKVNPFKTIFDIKKNEEFTANTMKLYRVTTQYKDKKGNIYQTIRTVDKDTYNIIAEGDTVYFDDKNNVEIYKN